ncbi:hypothetical protein R1sor_007699 [Riccia sorocarpa]|uniref:Uncharacterized protein n=1 Tax=Riccia sorocarpa TaxID=122646 RepID=A0ABD3HRI7_9MARC
MRAKRSSNWLLGLSSILSPAAASSPKQLYSEVFNEPRLSAMDILTYSNNNNNNNGRFAFGQALKSKLSGNVGQIHSSGTVEKEQAYDLEQLHDAWATTSSSVEISNFSKEFCLNPKEAACAEL